MTATEQRAADVAAFDAMQRAQGLEKVYGLDDVVQWLPWQDAARLGLSHLFAAKAALLDPGSKEPELKLGGQIEFERDLQKAFSAVDSAESYEAYRASDDSIWDGDFVPAVLIGHAVESVGGL